MKTRVRYIKHGPVIRRKAALALAVFMMAVLARAPSYASGHGPLFGLSEPVLGKGTVEVDEFYGIQGGPFSTGTMFTTMLAYGLTQDLQLSVTAPYLVEPGNLMAGRMNAMMPGNREAEGMAAWRFQKKEWGIGKRYGTTAYVGLDVPTGSNALGIRGGPGVYSAVATGYASRSQYLWGGIGYSHFSESLGDQRPGDLFYSGVWGYRPAFLRKLPWTKPDGRLFIEMIGNHLGTAQRGGLALPQTQGDQVMAGPTTLWLFKNFGVEGGVLFPVYQNFQPGVPRERYRVAIDLTYIFPFREMFHPQAK